MNLLQMKNFINHVSSQFSDEELKQISVGVVSSDPQEEQDSVSVQFGVNDEGEYFFNINY